TWSGMPVFKLHHWHFNNGATFTIEPGSSFDILGDGKPTTLAHDEGDLGTWNVAGTLRKLTGTGTTTFVATFNNTGTVEAQSGELRFQSGYSQTAGNTILSGGAITFDSPFARQGGVLSGTGVITGDIHNTGGNIQPGLGAGRITVAGNYTQRTGGSYTVEIGGTSPTTLRVGESELSERHLTDCLRSYHAARAT